MILEPPERRSPRLEVLQDISIDAPKDLEAELRFFYQQVIGLPEDRPADHTGGWLYFSGQDYRLIVRAGGAPGPPSLRRRAVLEVNSLAEVESLLQEHRIDYVKESGLAITGRRLHVTDPVGNRLELRQSWPL